MNAFKLLSRSTNLRATAKSGVAPTTQSLPSQGEVRDPRVYGRGADTRLQGTKRKRGQQTNEDKPEDLGELDFFGDASTRKAKKQRDSRSKDPSDVHDDTNIPHINDEAPEDPVAGEEECRQILKTHKIKATKLWNPEDGPDETASKKKMKKKKNRIEEESTKKEKRKRAEIIPQPLTHFSQLQTRYHVHRKVCDNLGDQGYEMPTEVQMGGLPLLLDNSGPQIDLLSVAPTGSGKTLAFLIPVINAVKRERGRAGADHKEKGVKAVILAPTKELASQIVNEGRKLALNTGIQITMLRKGMKIGDQGTTDDRNGHNSQKSDENAEKGGEDEQDDHKSKPEMVVKADVIVSTPLAMVHALAGPNKTVGNLPTTTMFILDEADVLLDPLFREQTLSIWAACSNPQLRVSLWSATMGASIEDLAASQIADRWAALPQQETKTTKRAPLVRLVIGLKDSSIPSIHHKLVYAATEQGKLMGLRQLLRGDPAATTSSIGKGPSETAAPVLRPPFLVFTQTIARAVALHAELLYDIPIEAGGSSRIAVLHSDLSETARDNVMTRFRKGEIWVLITTDLLSRGVDFRGVNGVVNYDFPNSSAAYIHRVGRTGRAGRQGGVAVTLYAKEDIPYVKNVANVIAASERMKDVGQSDGMSQWLLDMLPKVSKRDKQKLKKGGVESRRTGKEDVKTRISTKSGYERKIEARRKGAVEGSQRRAKAEPQKTTNDVSDDGFDGFD
ncbi:hypothetical protein FH972_021960 [Carpinus fangiana]|uniref:ATP-dependent RNA helicase n=1 Tax=Carpinus fangiana TaxID=176857 RepID=A0A5N6KT09_9ROSI|nr:hypothetical protein FH972_021960 [Carpinus fangiana]